jgi:SSS family solute:Na+ symporter
MKAFTGLVFGVILAGALSSEARSATLETPQIKLQTQAIDTLKTALAEQSKFIKVHAAEALLALSYGDQVADAFQKELALHGKESPYRIGIWRVLALAAGNDKHSAEYIQQLCNVALDPKSPDRGNAYETLAKLQYHIPPSERTRYEAASFDQSSDDYVCSLWLLAISGNDSDIRSLARLLDDASPRVRSLTAYALRQLRKPLPPDVVAQLTKKALATDSQSDVSLVAAAFALEPDNQQVQELKQRLLSFATSANADDRREVATVLAIRGSVDDLPLMTEYLSDQVVDVRIAGATAILRIDRRQQKSFNWLDWLVLSCYAGGMLLIGWYYSHAKNVEEYLLGGRTMKPWAVGISLFASLISTLSYLSVPGELIRHGPIILATALSYPFSYLIISRFIIPKIMRLRVTSAYEILEQRLGLSVRLLGSAMFLTLRLLWMALIVYATSAAVLVPLLHLDPSLTPWVCTALCLVTVAYTSMGGLRAVVVIDVVQVSIMFFGALLSIFLIVRSVGGISACWPSSWAPHWDQPSLLPMPGARVSVVAAVLAQLTWFVCTSGSDQMAVQRYLATRDVKAATKTLKIALCLDACVDVILASLGLALFAYFNAKPAMLPDGETMISGADQLLPHYIVRALPAGVSGLIIAGILSAAMNSLSSGVNSSCSVITVDWVDRFRKVNLTAGAHMREVKAISWFVGAAVIGLSLLAAFIHGNLLEKCYTIVALLVGPLFVLFFMAMFVPWATVFGTWVAAVASTAIAMAIAYGEFMGLSFLLVMPISLVVGVVVGCIASLVPIGPAARPMLEIQPLPSLDPQS